MTIMDSSKTAIILKLLLCIQIIQKSSSFELCPKEVQSICSCDLVEGKLRVDCSYRGLTHMPGELINIALSIQNLDLSNNNITEFPTGLGDYYNLEILDISNNRISSIREDALRNCLNLKYLHLNRNAISSWIDIAPNFLLKPATSLESLRLSENPITSFTSNDESLLLISQSLQILDLRNCNISKVVGQNVILGLPKLEHLYLNNNPIRTISDIMSLTLQSIDLSNLKLTYIQPTIFSLLPALTYASMAENHRLILSKRHGEVIESATLKSLDVSLCNMDQIDLTGFPSLTTVLLRGNMLRQLKQDTFENNLLINTLDLSQNAISYISADAFVNLKGLKYLDLSYNMIRRIDPNTFKANKNLTSINLSRNYVERFNRFRAESLTHLNMSWCEVMYIDIDVFDQMPVLYDLDLSNNLFSNFPVSLESPTLERLDLSMCRLSTLRKETFIGFPELSYLNLAGNRFTTPFRVDYFDDNLFLRDIWLGDNPWRCDCKSVGFREFYDFLLDPPPKINDRAHLRCISPDEYYGKSWMAACSMEWFPSANLGTVERVWTIIMASIMALCITLCLAMSVRKCIDGRRLQREEEERERNLEERREILRQNQRILEQEAQLNAPDPRETCPPCYEEAILMPRLDGSFASLNEIGLKRELKRANRIAKDSDELDSQIAMTARNRSRSEEVLSVRDRASQRPSRHERASRIEQTTNLSAANSPTDNPIELHYLVTDILEIHRRSDAGQQMEATIEQAPRTVTPVISQPSIDSEEPSHSPYAQRRARHMSSFRDQLNTIGVQPAINISDKSDKSSSFEVSSNGSEYDSEDSDNDNIHLIENHYSKPDIHKDDCESPTSSTSTEGFSTFSKNEITNLK